MLCQKNSSLCKFWGSSAWNALYCDFFKYIFVEFCTPNKQVTQSIKKYCDGEAGKQGHNLTEKELPQEQPWSAWGFLSTRKVERISSWLKSTVDPFTYSRLSWSTMMPTPSCSNTLSSSFLLLSTENLYWNPEQPPPSTCILRYWPLSMISPSLFTHDSVRFTLSSDGPGTAGFSWAEALLKLWSPAV